MVVKHDIVRIVRWKRFLPESGSEEARQTLQSAQTLFIVYSTAQNLRKICAKSAQNLRKICAKSAQNLRKICATAQLRQMLIFEAYLRRDANRKQKKRKRYLSSIQLRNCATAQPRQMRICAVTLFIVVKQTYYIYTVRWTRFLPESGSEEDRQTLHSAQKLFIVCAVAQLRNCAKC